MRILLGVLGYHENRHRKLVGCEEDQGSLFFFRVPGRRQEIYSDGPGTIEFRRDKQGLFHVQRVFEERGEDVGSHGFLGFLPEDPQNRFVVKGVTEDAKVAAASRKGQKD